jgi:hypothetical protein
MTMRTMVRLVATIVLATVLGLGVPAPTPAGADPADTYLPWNTLSRLNTPHGCLYKVAFGNVGTTAYALIHVYNFSGCGTWIVVGIQYLNNGVIGVVTEDDPVATGSDGCGSYQVIQINAPGASIALRAVVAFQTAGYHRWYDTDGTHNQPTINC